MEYWICFLKKYQETKYIKQGKKSLKWYYFAIEEKKTVQRGAPLANPHTLIFDPDVKYIDTSTYAMFLRTKCTKEKILQT